MSQPASEPARKRQRVTQACHRCRGKKYKCDSERPSCSTCRSSNSECIYGPVAKRRGLQSGYVKALEILWGLVFRKVEGSQLVVNELLANLSSIIHPSPDEGTSNGINRADDLLDCWRNSGVPSAIELMLDGEFISNPNGTLEGVDGQVDHSLASVQTWSLPGIDLLQGTPPQAPSPQLPPQVPSPPAAAVVPIASCPSEDIIKGHQPTLSPLPPDWHSLTQVYLTVEHSWFPILERHTLFRIAYQYQDESDSPTAMDDRHRGEYATLWAVLALGEIHSSNASSSRAVHFKFVSRYFLDKDPLLEDYASYTQALLLWAVIHLGCNKLVLARSMLAQAIVFCCAIGPELSQRQRTLALSGCFVMDALLSLALDTRPMMSVDDFPATVPCDETGSDEWEPYVDRFGSQRHSDLSTPALSNLLVF
ncbi:hypothetical protein E4T49_03261 [Aureobasidium sp. EXF-10728]|nr:hypothetical protein E4T49_03261 [Aureobasidium sp. EXF-10728]